MMANPPAAPRKHWSQSRALPWWITVLTLAVYGAGIVLVARQLQREIRREIVSDDGDVLHAVALMLQMEQAAALPGAAGDEPAMLFDVVLKASRLRGVIAARLFDGGGKFVVALPANMTEGGMNSETLARLRQGETVCRFHEDYPRSSLFLSGAAGQGVIGQPLVETFIPLPRAGGRDFAGAAQFFMDGRGVANQLTRLDREINGKAGLVFVLGGLLISLGLLWSFHRLQRAHRLLVERSAGLLAANQQLALLTRTSAVGAVVTHLLHELKSQAFGLRSLLSVAPAAADAEESRRAAAESARRMQQMISELFSAIRNDQGTTQHYEISLAGLAELLARAVQPLAQRAGVRCVTEQKAQGTLSSRVANLVVIILTHLLQNAIQATAAGRAVTLTLDSDPENLHFKVRDEGPGFPAALRGAPFAPCASTKEGGSGVGLALSKQLASHLGAELELAESSAAGCLFVLRLPKNLIAEKTVLADG
ncbi:MAG: sensor histidine kinase [Verrucomicrobia bacterium]|nr:sensor histidine kinase [Verrucomicrobiota bacterium]